MFCTSIRRRASFASIVPTLNAPPLALRESQLGTHDLEIPFAATIDQHTGNTLPSRSLRVLLISPAGVHEGRLDDTMQRIRHFAALTGGEDLLIVFLLNTRPATSFVTAKHLAAQSSKGEGSVEGICRHSELLTEMIKHPDIPHVPVLPLSNVESVQKLVKDHIDFRTRAVSTPKSLALPLDLLQQCTANQPMSQQTAYILSDLFPSLRALQRACSSVIYTPKSSSPSARVANESLQMTGITDAGLLTDAAWSYSTAAAKLNSLRDLVGDGEFRDIVDFWKEEWIVD